MRLTRDSNILVYAFDAAATAAEAGCRLILSEDKADGAAFHGVAIRNPFDASGEMTGRVRELLRL